MKHIDWEAGRPDEDAILESWGRVSYEPIPAGGPATERFLAHVHDVYRRGGAILARFRVTGGDATLHWFAARNLLCEYDFFKHFLGSEPVERALPQLRIPQILRFLPFRDNASGLLTLDGELAALLVEGGAYKRFEGPAAEAKRLGVACVTELTQDRYEDFLVYTSQTNWAPWFRGGIWDATWLLVDRRDSEVTLLCVTDES
ncbi:MAG TPA: hypothetical protein VF062_10725 [Candidatus Limnocylindrales bacterium]